MFPASWIVQSRLADVATIVEENVTGTRVVKSFAGEAQQVGLLQKTAERLRWANNVMIDMRARYGPLMQNLPRLGAVFVILYGGWLGVHGRITVGDLFTFTSYIALLQAPFMILGLHADAGAARRSIGRPDLRDPRSRSRASGAAGRGRSHRPAGRRGVRRGRPSPTTRKAPTSSTASRCTCGPARRSRWSAAPAAASRPSPD